MGSVNSNSYGPPVNQLFSYGEAEGVLPSEWPDYQKLGLGSEQIPDLIRIATDKDLHQVDSERLDVWAPVHAVRTLGQLRAEEAIEPLLSLFDLATETGDEWVIDELPDVYGMLGPVAFPALAAYLADLSHDENARGHAVSSIGKIVVRWPEARQTAVELLMKQLERFVDNGLEANGYLIITLAEELGAVEAAPLIEQAYEADCVDLMVAGDWDNVQVELGLMTAEEADRRYAAGEVVQHYDARNVMDKFPAGSVTQRASLPLERRPPEASHPKASKQKAKSKMAKQSRKKNRKR